MGHMRFDSRFVQQFLNFARGILQGQCEMILGMFAEFIDLFQIFFRTDEENMLDLCIGKALRVGK